jgi:hypothetical protein
VISAKKPNGNKESSVSFADPVAKLNPHVTWQTNYRWFAGLQGDFILTKRTYCSITDQLFEALVVVLEPGWNIPAHLFVSCKQQARPKSIVGVNLRHRRAAKPEPGANRKKPSQPASPEHARPHPPRQIRCERAHAFSSDAGYKRSRKLRPGRTFLLRS